MRNGLSPNDWAEKNAPLLKDLQFKYLDGTALETTTQGMKASVTLKVQLFVLIGESI
jgi:hypothetical protein